MNKIELEEKYILEYIKDMLNESKIKSKDVENAIYHHTTEFEYATDTIKYGILPIIELNRLGIRKYSKKLLDILADTESHINGIDGVSLSVLGLTDRYRGEDDYDPRNPYRVDFIISNEIEHINHVDRNTTFYFNEFIAKGIITPDKIKAADIRLLDLIQTSKEDKIKDIVKKYNYLKDIALAIKEYNLDISIREMSNGNLTIDTDAFVKTPKIIIK